MRHACHYISFVPYDNQRHNVTHVNGVVLLSGSVAFLVKIPIEVSCRFEINNSSYSTRIVFSQSISSHDSNTIWKGLVLTVVMHLISGLSLYKRSYCQRSEDRHSAVTQRKDLGSIIRSSGKNGQQYSKLKS